MKAKRPGDMAGTIVATDPTRDEGPMGRKADPTRDKATRILIAHGQADPCPGCGGTQFEGTLDASAWPAIVVEVVCRACGRAGVIQGRFRQRDPLAPYIWWFDAADARSARPLMAPPIPVDIRAIFDEADAAPPWVHPAIVGVARGLDDRGCGYCGIPPYVAAYYRNWGRWDIIDRGMDWAWEDYPLARRLDRCNGIVFLPENIDAMRRLPGVITDIDLFPVD